MNVLKITKLFYDKDAPELEDVSRALDRLGIGEKIEIINWNNYSYKPDVRFNIGYNKKELFIKYYVKEKYLKAEKTKSNEMVCEDSCVEFFVTPPGCDFYYNFEFNCIGTCLMGKGHSREDNNLVSSDIIHRIRRKSSLGNKPFNNKTGDYSWTITIAIPLEIFMDPDINKLKNKKFKANFFKCGDKLEKAHYLSWNKITTKNPDFHRPEFFGNLEFV